MLAYEMSLNGLLMALQIWLYEQIDKLVFSILWQYLH